MEPGSVSVQCAVKNGRVAEHVQDDENDHQLAGDGHEELSGNSGSWKGHSLTSDHVQSEPILPRRHGGHGENYSCCGQSRGFSPRLPVPASLCQLFPSPPRVNFLGSSSRSSSSVERFVISAATSLTGRPSW